ncbi:MAG: hypothetical protein IAG13_37955 [Deltaproteobacteria bacterium]|nr:hypothetical protein [Nannocystaceae bacterium]
MATSARLLPSLIGLACLAGCNNPAYYQGAQRLAVTAADIAAAGGEDSMTGNPTIGAYVQGEYWLDFRDPGADELAELQPMGTMPAEQIPWIRAEELTISVPWKLTNETNAPITAWVLLDGATEFYDYDPISTYGAAGGEDEDEVQYPSLLGFTPRNVAPGQVLQGEFREDDLREALYDLDVITRFCGGPLAVLNHRHEADPAGTDAVPTDAVLAGAVMLRLTLGASGPATLEYSVRLRQSEAKIYDSARDERRYETDPEPYMLPSAPVAVDTGTGGEMAMCEAGE